jgi:predicted transcriptional regulator of viral defense system
MNDIQLLEQLLIKKGRIITHSNLKSLFSNYKNLNNKISLLIKKGWLVNLRKGQYYITKLGSLGYISTSHLIISNSIGIKSFVSFEAALKHHGLFDQGLKKIRAISYQQYRQKKLENTTYQYITVKTDNYFGFKKESVDGGIAIVANKERALLDLIEYQRSIYSVSLVLEKLENFSQEIDLKILVKYLKEYSQVTIKTIGLFLDFMNIDSSQVFNLINDSTSSSRLLSSSATFSSKWRLYYDHILKEWV